MQPQLQQQSPMANQNPPAQPQVSPVSQPAATSNQCDVTSGALYAPLALVGATSRALELAAGPMAAGTPPQQSLSDSEGSPVGHEKSAATITVTSASPCADQADATGPAVAGAPLPAPAGLAKDDTCMDRGGSRRPSTKSTASLVVVTTTPSGVGTPKTKLAGVEWRSPPVQSGSERAATGTVAKRLAEAAAKISPTNKTNNNGSDGKLTGVASGTAVLHR